VIDPLCETGRAASLSAAFEVFVCSSECVGWPFCCLLCGPLSVLWIKPHPFLYETLYFYDMRGNSFVHLTGAGGFELDLLFAWFLTRLRLYTVDCVDGHGLTNWHAWLAGGTKGTTNEYCVCMNWF
jgi:hypothetical protein